MRSQSLDAKGRLFELVSFAYEYMIYDRARQLYAKAVVNQEQEKDMQAPIRYRAQTTSRSSI